MVYVLTHEFSYLIYNLGVNQEIKIDHYLCAFNRNKCT